MSKDRGKIVDASFSVTPNSDVKALTLTRRETLKDIGKGIGALAGVIAIIEAPGAIGWYLDSKRGNEEPLPKTVQEWLAKNRSLVETTDILTDKESDKTDVGFSIKHPAKSPGVTYEVIGDGTPEFVLGNDERILLTNPDTNELVDTKFFPENFHKTDGSVGIVLAFFSKELSRSVLPIGPTGVDTIIHPYLLQQGQNPRIESSVVEFSGKHSQWYYNISRVKEHNPNAQAQFGFTQLQRINHLDTNQ